METCADQSTDRSVNTNGNHQSPSEWNPNYGPDYLPTMSAAKTSKHSLLVKHHILAIDEAS